MREGSVARSACTAAARAERDGAITRTPSLGALMRRAREPVRVDRAPGTHRARSRDAPVARTSPRGACER
ncbi:MAG: hypothetical protein A2W00_05855 [Candidatus Eisenbacteria bacterium RBG_16_71_46]|nr:MAG: hypothetical protein A2W00_05855 [Candidatus Eisenbacteria bacterium RBG_16_71_46]OGF23852.1 MAG: hypothetical protein A2V63_13540 [Candidatus Eisenbacteria bacterium RBG_19FT_COMBO_70_11]